MSVLSVKFWAPRRALLAALLCAQLIAGVVTVAAVGPSAGGATDDDHTAGDSNNHSHGHGSPHNHDSASTGCDHHADSDHPLDPDRDRPDKHSHGHRASGHPKSTNRDGNTGCDCNQHPH